MPLFGTFVADLVVGDSINKAFAFIEFEDASAGSIFTVKRGKEREKGKAKARGRGRGKARARARHTISSSVRTAPTAARS